MLMSDEADAERTQQSGQHRGRINHGHHRGGRRNHSGRAGCFNNNASYKIANPKLMTEKEAALREDLESTESNQRYFESKKMEDFQHQSRNTSSAGSVSREFHKESAAVCDVQGNNFQSTKQKSSHTNQNDSYRQSTNKGQRTFHKSYGNSRGRGQMDYHNSNEEDQNRVRGRQRGYNSDQRNYFSSGYKDNYTNDQKETYNNGQRSQSYGNSRGRGQMNDHNSNEEDQNRVRGRQRGYNSDQRNYFSSGYKDNYTNDQKETYNNGQRSTNTCAHKVQNYSRGGKYVEKSYPKHGERVARGDGNSRQHRGGSGNSYGSKKYYQYSSDNYKGTEGGYSSPSYHQSHGAVCAGGNGSAEENIEKEEDLIQQFQQCMLLQGDYTTEDINAINAKQLLNKSKTNESGRKIPSMEGISNIYRIYEQSLQEKIKKQVKDMFGRTRKYGFSGCFPVNLNHENISNLRNYPHKVSWKADGIRYMMLIEGEQKIYLISFDNIYHIQGLEFRHKHDLKQHVIDTLLEGELIIHVNPQTGVEVYQFLIFDAIKIEGRLVTSEIFHRRHEIIETELIKPRNIAITKGLLDTKQEPFIVRQKQFWDASPQAVKQLLSRFFLDQVGHDTDGLIFQRNKGPYVSGPTDTVLKFKPDALNAINFKLIIKIDKGVKCGLLYVGRSKEPFGNIEITEEIENLHGEIIECSYIETGWVFLRHRPDRNKPNAYDTAVAKWETIANPVNEFDLFNSVIYKC